MTRALGCTKGEFCCTIVKYGNLLLRMRRGCMGGVSYDEDVWCETG